METSALQALLRQVIRAGIVTETNPHDGTVRVVFEDGDRFKSAPLPVLVAKAYQDKALWLPDVGERVLCLFLPYGREQGFVLGAFYSGERKPSVASQDTCRLDFKDGTWLEYDRAAHVLSGHVAGSVSLDVAQGLEATVGQGLVATVGQDCAVTVTGNATVKAAQAVIEAPQILLRTPGGALTDLDGVLTKRCVCSLTGLAHLEGSQIVKASKE